MNSLVIGAPKTNSRLYNVRQSGTVFSCQLFSNDSTNCGEIYIDFSEFSILFDLKFIELKHCFDSN